MMSLMRSAINYKGYTMSNVINLSSKLRQKQIENEMEHKSYDDILVSIPSDIEFDEHVSFNDVTKEIVDL